MSPKMASLAYETCWGTSNGSIPSTPATSRVTCWVLVVLRVRAPAPWWKMDYFEIRKEDPRDNRRYFYQFEGDGIRDELADFVRRIRNEARESIVTEEQIGRAHV